MIERPTLFCVCVCVCTWVTLSSWVDKIMCVCLVRLDVCVEFVWFSAFILQCSIYFFITLFHCLCWKGQIMSLDLFKKKKKKSTQFIMGRWISTLKSIKWHYQAHLILCNMTRCIRRINGCYWRVRIVPHAVDCIDTRSRAHLPISSLPLHASSNSVKREKRQGRKRVKYVVHVCA